MDSKAPNIFPALRYADAAKALRWLHEAFGFEQVMSVPGEGDTVAHAEMRLGAGTIMFGSGKPEPSQSADPRDAPFTIYVAVQDPDAHCATARAAGAEITMELTDMDYGSREYAARDFEGNHWSFGTYQPVPE